MKLVDERLKRFLGSIDTAFLATASADGQPYVQHRGGPKGFIKAADEHTLAFVDFSGNKQYITTQNLAENDRVLLFLIDYERRRRVKVWGHAKLVEATPALIARFADAGYDAEIEQVMFITVDRWDANCPQHIPQLVHAEDVIARITELERENATLRKQLASARV